MSGTVFLIVRVLMALALYAFVGWGFWTLWRLLKKEIAAVTTPPIAWLSLTHRIDHYDEVYEFHTPEVIVGRDPASDLHLEDKTISARHARLSFHHGQWWVEDLRSTNGTFVNQEQVIEPLVIISGDRIRFGQIAMEVTVEDAESSKSRSGSGNG